MPTKNFSELLNGIRRCNACEGHLPLGPRPLVQAAEDSRILIVGQAPGLKTHHSGIPWDDASGDRLREWLGVDKEKFYNPRLFAIVPVGFCYPGRGESGDLPPRKECAPLWFPQLMPRLKRVRLTILAGQYAQWEFLKEGRKATLTSTVKAWRDYAPGTIPLPHPSPLNNIWLAKNRWFEKTLVPELRKAVAKALLL